MQQFSKIGPEQDWNLCVSWSVVTLIGGLDRSATIAGIKKFYYQSFISESNNFNIKLPVDAISSRVLTLVILTWSFG